MEERNATASPNTESPSETGDSDADPKYSFSDDSFSNISYSNSSSLHETNICAMNELQNVDLNTETKHKKRAEKEKEPRHSVRKDITPNCCEIHTHTHTQKL